MKRNSGIIGPLQETTLSVASGIFDTYDQHLRKKISLWPAVIKYISCTESTSTVVEGASMSFAVVTEGLIDGHTLYYTINTVSGTTMDADDFGGTSIATSFTVTSNAATLNFTLTAEGDPGDAESNTFKLEIRTVNTSGTVVMESGVVTVTDAIASGEDIRSAFYEISNRFLDSYTYMGGNADYDGPYDVGEVQQDYAGDVRIYLVHKVTASPTYYNDTPVAAVVHLNSSNVVQTSWIFHSSSGGSGSGWETKQAIVTGTSSVGTGFTPETASGYTYSTILSSSSNSKWSWASSTGSASTGAAGGIADDTTSFPVGDAQIAQVGAHYYAYRETSGSTRWSSAVMRSPSFTIAAGDKLRVVHALTGPPGHSIDADDSLWIGVY